MMKDLKYFESLIVEKPQYIGWYNPEGFHDSIDELPKFIDGISDEDKVFATIAAYNQIDLVASYKTICKVTGFERNKVKNIIYQQKPLVYLHATHSEETGLLNGKGWVFNDLF
jgi:hypothetical protein